MNTLPLHIKEHIYKIVSEEFLKFKPTTRNALSNPFFVSGSHVEKNPFVENRKLCVNLPNTLKEIYEKYDNTTEFVTETGWIFLSEHDIYERYTVLKTNRIDIAIKYKGMGHVYVLAFDLSSNLVFEDEDGGSSPIERMYNHQRRMETDINDIGNKMSFDAWKIQNT